MQIPNDTNAVTEQRCAAPMHTNYRSKMHINAFKNRDPNTATLRLTNDEPHHGLHQSNTLPFRKSRKQVDSTVKANGINHPLQPEIPNSYSLNPNISMSSNRIELRRPNEHTLESLIGANSTPEPGSSNTVIESNSVQSMKLNQSTNAATQIVYSTDMDKLFIENRNAFARNRLQAPTCHYEQLCAKQTIANRLQPLQLPSSTARFQNNSQSLPKDLARYSICSADSDKTDYTDLSPMTPQTPHAKNESICSSDLQYELKSIAQSKIYEDFTEAGCSRSSPAIQLPNPLAQRYFSCAEQRFDTKSVDRTNKIAEMHARPTHLAESNSNHQLSTTICDKGSKIHGTSDLSIVAYEKLKRRNPSLRPKNSLFIAQNELEHRGFKNTGATTSITRRTHSNDDSSTTNNDQQKPCDVYGSTMSGGAVWLGGYCGDGDEQL